MDIESINRESQESKSGSTKDLVDDPESTEAKILENRKIRQEALEEKWDLAVKKMQEMMEEAFSLYELLLSEDLRKNWVQCVSKICNRPCWIDEDGVFHNNLCECTWDGLEQTTKERLLCKFPQDAAEQQCHYLSFYITLFVLRR